MERKELRIRRLIEEATDQGLRRDVDLWPAIHERLRGGQRRAPGPALVRGGLLMRRVPVFLIAVVALVVTGTAMAMPAVRAQVAEWLGFGVEQQKTLPPLIARVLDRAPWDIPDGQGFEMYTVELPQARWETVAQAEAQGLAVPEPGTRIPLPDGDVLPVPTYLPEGYRWQSVERLQNVGAPSLGHRGRLLSLGNASAAGGGNEPLPPHDRDVNYLVGGDRADHLLILAQFEGDADQTVLFQAYHVVSPERQPAKDSITAASPSGSVPTPTPVASYYAAKVQVGVVVPPATDQKGLVFLVGSCELHETTVGGVQGLWYRGTWNAAGQWVDDRTTSLIWQHGSVTYQLTGQGVTLADLVRIAESMPS